jgi:uncharacterized protein
MDKFDSLMEMLRNEPNWPLEYLFKFILKSNQKENQKKIRGFFEQNVSISFRESSQGNYLAVSITAKMNDPEEIIEIYKKAAQIEGLITF